MIDLKRLGRRRSCGSAPVFLFLQNGLKGDVSRQLAQDNMFIDAISPTERELKRHK